MKWADIYLSTRMGSRRPQSLWSVKWRLLFFARQVCGDREPNSKRRARYQSAPMARSEWLLPTERRLDWMGPHHDPPLRSGAPCNYSLLRLGLPASHARAYRCLIATTVMSWATCCHTP